MRDTNYTIAQQLVPAHGRASFFATPRTRSPCSYFTIEQVGQVMEADLVVEDIRVNNVSQLADLESEPLAVELFSPICAPGSLTLPSVTVDSRMELVLSNNSDRAVPIKVKFYWVAPGAGLGS